MKHNIQKLSVQSDPIQSNALWEAPGILSWLHRLALVETFFTTLQQQQQKLQN